MFDVHLDLSVTLDATARQGFPAHAEIRVIANETNNRGKWRLIGPQDRRLPHFGDAWHEWARDSRDVYALLLLFKGKPWARLMSFDKAFESNADGPMYATHLPGGPPPYDMPQAHGWYVGGWNVNRKARQGNMPTPVGSDDFISTALSICSRDSGWRYDTSASDGFSGGWAGGGGGLMRSRLVLKRKEAADNRRWDVTCYVGGFGVMTPGAGYSGSTETTTGGALSDIMAGVGAPSPFPIESFGGAVMMFEGSVGAALGKGKVGVGGGRSRTYYLFFGGVASDGILPDVGTVKACFSTWSQSGSASKGPGVGGSGIAYLGYASVGKARAPH